MVNLEICEGSEADFVAKQDLLGKHMNAMLGVPTHIGPTKDITKDTKDAAKERLCKVAAPLSFLRPRPENTGPVLRRSVPLNFER